MSIAVPELDPADLDVKNFNCGHEVNYFVYREKGGKWAIPKDNDNRVNKNSIITHICFATLANNLNRKNPPNNRVMYCIRSRSKAPLIDKEMRYFLKVSQDNGAIPSYVDIDQVVEKKKFVLKIDSTVPNDLVYTYLTTVRMLEEETGFVRNILVLTGRYKMPYSLAWLVASRISIQNSWHNIVNIGIADGMYGNTNVEERLKADVSIIKALAITKYLRERPKEHHKVSKRVPGFDTSSLISKFESHINPKTRNRHDLRSIKAQKVFDEKIYKEFDKI